MSSILETVMLQRQACFGQLLVLQFTICIFSLELLSRSNVLDGPIFRWHIPYFWHWGDLICRARPGGSHRSHGLHFSPHDKVHFPQVWLVGRDREAWCHVHLATEHCQREDLHFPVVLAITTLRPDVPCGGVPNVCHFFTANAGLPAIHSLPPGEKGVHQHHHQEDQNGWLVSLIHAGTKHRLNSFQGGLSRVSEKAGLPQQRHLWLLVKWCELNNAKREDMSHQWPDNKTELKKSISLWSS